MTFPTKIHLLILLRTGIFLCSTLSEGVFELVTLFPARHYIFIKLHTCWYVSVVNHQSFGILFGRVSGHYNAIRGGVCRVCVCACIKDGAYLIIGRSPDCGIV